MDPLCFDAPSESSVEPAFVDRKTQLGTGTTNICVDSPSLREHFLSMEPCFWPSAGGRA